MPLDLRSTISLDGSGFESGLKGIERGAERAGEVLKGLALAAVGIYGIENALHHTIETAEQLVDTSRRLGVSLEALQEFGYAARQNGADIEKLTTFIERLNSTRIDPKKFESFGKLGINQSDLNNLKVEDLIMKLSANVQNRSSQEVIGPLRDIGGKQAGQMLVMLKDNLAELREEAHKLGVIIKTQDAVMLKFLADEMTILAQIIVSGLAPAIVTIEEKFLRFMNVIKAIGTFMGTLFGGSMTSKDWRTVLDAFMHPFSVTPARKAAVDKMKANFEKAFDAFSLEYYSGDKKIDEQIAALVKKQKEIEKINSIPDFESVMPEEKAKKQHSGQLQSDALTRVGNFLGSAQNPMISIGHQQLLVLKQIANNTQWRKIAGHGGSGFPQH